MKLHLGGFVSSVALCLFLATPARADVHTIRINEYYIQCNNGRRDVQYIELRPTTLGQFFRQCASIQVKRTVAGPDIFFAKPVFAGHGNEEDFTPTTRTFLIATPAFQAATGIVPDLVMPNGTLPAVGGVIRFAADSGCEPNVNWGTMHEVRYGDQGTAPLPGAHQSANWNNGTQAFVLGTKSPKNFANVTAANWTCDTVAPTVNVLAPNGGENLTTGVPFPITWAATDSGIITTVSLDYSTNGGTNFNPIAAGEANDGSYSWLVPATPTTQALVRVTVNDFAGNSGQDQSNSVFSIVQPSVEDTIPPTVNVLRPNGGENFIEGTNELIEWSATDDVGIEHFELYYTTNMGGLWQLIAAGEPNDGVFDWQVPNDPAMGTALIRVVARDSSGNEGSDESDAAFSIQDLASVPFLPPVITRPILFQNRPNPFNPGTRIGFALPASGHVRLEVFSLAGQRVKLLADGVQNKGYTEFTWDGRDDQGRGVPSGIYFYRFDAGTTHEVRRMVLAK